MKKHYKYLLANFGFCKPSLDFAFSIYLDRGFYLYIVVICVYIDIDIDIDKNNKKIYDGKHLW